MTIKSKDYIADESTLISDLDFFHDLYTNQFAYIRAYGYSLTKDVAICEDIAQEVFVLAWRNLAKVRAHPEPQGWLVLAAQYQAGRYFRDKAKQKKLHNIPFAQKLSNAAASRDISLLQHLKADDAQIIAMYYADELTLLEIAEKLGIAHNTAKKRLSRARERYKKIFLNDKNIKYFLILCHLLPISWHYYVGGFFHA